MNEWIEDIRTKHNLIHGRTRAFLSHILRDPTGSASDFQAFLNEDERKALYANINEKIPRALLRSLWPSNELDGTGLLHALLQHAINPADMSITLNTQRSVRFVYGSDSKKRLCIYFSLLVTS